MHGAGARQEQSWRPPAESRGVGPRLHGFFTQAGVEDGSAGPSAPAPSSGVRLRCANDHRAATLAAPRASPVHAPAPSPTSTAPKRCSEAAPAPHSSPVKPAFPADEQSPATPLAPMPVPTTLQEPCRADAEAKSGDAVAPVNMLPLPLSLTQKGNFPQREGHCTAEAGLEEAGPHLQPSQGTSAAGIGFEDMQSLFTRQECSDSGGILGPDPMLHESLLTPVSRRGKARAAGTSSKCPTASVARQERGKRSGHKQNGSRTGVQAPEQAPPASPGSCSAVAMAKTTAFLSSIRLALQEPLISRPPVQGTPNPVPAPRRSGRLASRTVNALVRPSKKGEILAMRKLGIISREEELHQEAAKDFDRFLVTAMRPQHFAALRDIFPAARELSDDDLRMVAQQAACTSSST
nr:skin secretory protein xP2-like isoform X1 [Setaria viridis]